MKLFLDKTLGLMLFLICGILPFSSGKITNRWLVLFIFLMAMLFYLLILQRKKYLNIQNLAMVYGVLLMLIFSFAEKVNFIQQFNLDFELKKRIPLSTILLCIAILLFLIKIITEKEITVSFHPFAKYIFLTSIFILFLSTLFYPFLHHTFGMGFSNDAQLLNYVLKYLFILLFTFYYLSNKVKLRRITLGLIISIGLTVVLNIAF